jgi:hypothetical protein
MDGDRKEVVRSVVVLAFFFVGLALTKIFLVGLP